VVGLPVLLIALVLLLANIGPGRRLIEQQIESLTGGQVVLRGLAGRFPDRLRLAHLDIKDASGVWLSADNAALDWSPSALLHGVALVDRLTAARLVVARLPVAGRQTPDKKSAPGGFSLPVTIALSSLSVGRLDLGAALAGRPAQLRLSGTGRFASLQSAAATLSIDRLDAAGTYRLRAALDPTAIDARLSATEPAGGLLSGLAKLPALGALSLKVSIAGPRAAEHAQARLSAGPLDADADGLIDLARRTASLEITARAPAMAPRPDLSWRGLSLQARLRGPFTRPDIEAHAVLQQLNGGGASVASLTLDAAGNRGAFDLHGALTGLLLPPPKPGLFAAAPLTFAVHAKLDDPALPIRFSLQHPLLSADGTAQAGGDLAARIHAVVPSLAPLAAIANLGIEGRTEATATLATHGEATDVTIDGTAAFTGGLAPLPDLLGATSFGATARLTGQDIRISRAIVDGRAAHASLTGTDSGRALALDWTVALTDLHALSPLLVGALHASGHAQGPPSGLALQAEIAGDVGTRSVPRGPISIAVDATGLPTAPAGTIAARGRLAGAPLSLKADLQLQPDGALHAHLISADWKSLSAHADLTRGKGQILPTGTLAARMRLADLAPLIGQPLAGSLDASLSTTGAGAASDAKIDLRASDIGVPGATLARLSLSGHVRDPAAHPQAALVLDAAGLQAGGISGASHLTLGGPATALRLALTTALTVAGAPATAAARAQIDIPARRATLQTLTASTRGEDLRLQDPARIDVGAQTSVDRLRLLLGPAGQAPASLDIAGRIAPSLSLTAALRHLTPALAEPFAPALHAAGVLTADANLTGSLAAPQGTVRLQAAGLRMRAGPAASLPAAGLAISARLDGHAAHIDAQASAGRRLTLSASGVLPLQGGTPLTARATAAADLAVLNPLLGASGKRAAGQLSLDATLGGTLAAPSISGTASLRAGELQDYAQGVRLSAIEAELAASGDSVRIVRFTAGAGAGTLAATGTIGLLSPGLPVDLHLTADHATPLASDLLRATLDADLSVSGQASALKAAGRIFVRRADINIPNGFPPGVAVLKVRLAGATPPPAPPAASASALVNLAITIDAPSDIFVRGHGLDAELGGRLTLGGTNAAPQIGGGFQMRNGSFSLAGTTLTFSKGEIGFDGSGVNGKIDPTLDFVADSTSGSVTATLTVGGYADAPKITLSSVPDLPQDEVLAHLLFGESVKDLSTLQLAEIAAALADLSGVTGGAGDPLGAVRKGLGLDRLSVGNGVGGSGATIEGGRYVARGVYVGARQATSGGNTAAELQIDLTRHLKAEAQLATGGGSVQGATPENDPGSTIGLSYQFDY
jgi:translocation and assembly module TamB